MQKIGVSGTVLLLVILSLAILPQLVFGQIPTLDNLHLSSNEVQHQCLDFNQDTVCEFIVLANGTMVENPENQRPTPASISQSEYPSQENSGQKLISGGAYDFPKCLGHIKDGCKNILLSNGTMIKNPRNQSMTIYVQEKLDPQVYEDPNYYYYFPDSNPEVGKATVEESGPADENEEDEAEVYDTTSSSDNDDDDDDEKTANCGGEACTPTEKENSWTDEEQPYCDESGIPTYPESCFDRKDYSEDTGLYPCRDGSYEEDWRDCD